MNKNNKIIHFLTLIFLTIFLSFSVIGATYTADYTNFGLGTFTNTQIVDNGISLYNTFTTGSYTSPVINFNEELFNSNNFQSLLYSQYSIADLSPSKQFFYYSFEESSGNFIDRVSSIEIANSNVLYSQPGKVGNSVYYSGADTSFSRINPFPTATINKFSLSLWIKGGDTGDKTLISYATTAEKKTFTIHNMADLRVIIDNNELDTNINIADNQWHHIAFTWTSATGILNVYKDGILTSSAIKEQGYTFNGGGSLMFGQLQSAVGVVDIGKGFTGYLDEVSLFTDVLSETEIKKIYGKYAQTLNVSVRSCDDPLCDGENYYTLQTPENENKILNENVYFQYKFDLNGLVDSSPTIKNLIMNYSTSGEALPVEVFAFQEYKKLGFDNFASYNSLVEGAWGVDTLDNLKQDPKPLNNEENIASPKVAYMDDGKKYIIMTSKNSVTLYQWDDQLEQLKIIDGFPFPTGDVSGDFVIHKLGGSIKIVVPLKVHSGETYPQYIGFLSYDGNFDYDVVSVGNGYGQGNVFSPTRDLITYATQLNCYDDYCITSFVTQYNIPFVGNYGRFRVVMLDNNGIIDSYEDTSKSFLYTSGEGACMFTPTGAIPIIGNIDNDFLQGDQYDYTDVIITYSGVETSSLKVYLQSFNIVNDTIESDWVTTRTIGSMSSNCNNYPYPYIPPASFSTGVMALEYNGVDGDGKELVYGALDNGAGWNDYQLIQYKANGDFDETHPDLLNLEGRLLSNPLKLDCFEKGTGNDIGVLIYNEDTQKVSLLCSCGTCAGQDDCEVRAEEETAFFNITKLINVGHSVHTIVTDKTRGDSIVTPLGIYDIDPVALNCDGVGDGLNKIYDITERDSIIIPIDYQNNGRADLLFSSNSILKYLDDGFSNKLPYINSLIFDPCVGDQTIFRGSDLLIKAKAIDEENDLISWRVKLYADTINEIDSGWSPYQSASLEYRFNDVLDYDIGVGYIEIYVKDSKHTTFNMVEQIFSVNNNTQSASFGDCINTLTEDELFIGQDTGGALPSSDPNYVDEDGNLINDNSITNGANYVGGLVGLGGGLVFLILLLVAIFSIWKSNDNPNLGTFGVIAIVFIGGLIVGVKLKLIGFGTLMIFILLLIILVAQLMKNFLFPSNSGGMN